MCLLSISQSRSVIVVVLVILITIAVMLYGVDIQTFTVPSHGQVIQLGIIEKGGRLDIRIVIALHVIHACVCGSIHPFGHELMCIAARLPVSTVALIELEDNQKCGTGHQNTDGVRMKDVFINPRSVNVVFSKEKIK